MNTSMDCLRQHGKQSNKNIDVKRLEKDGSINISLALYSFEEEDKWYIDSGFSHHMTADKSKMESLKKSPHGKLILRNNAPAKVLGKGRAKINKHRGAFDTLPVWEKWQIKEM